ncbi:MAG: hypothetical protein AB2L26_11050 [Ignavibacteria bacterium]
MTLITGDKKFFRSDESFFTGDGDHVSDAGSRVTGDAFRAPVTGDASSMT